MTACHSWRCRIRPGRGRYPCVQMGSNSNSTYCKQTHTHMGSYTNRLQSGMLQVHHQTLQDLCAWADGLPCSHQRPVTRTRTQSPPVTAEVPAVVTAEAPAVVTAEVPAVITAAAKQTTRTLTRTRTPNPTLTCEGSTLYAPADAPMNAPADADVVGGIPDLLKSTLRMVVSRTGCPVLSSRKFVQGSPRFQGVRRRHAFPSCT